MDNERLPNIDPITEVIRFQNTLRTSTRQDRILVRIVPTGQPPTRLDLRPHYGSQSNQEYQLSFTKKHHINRITNFPSPTHVVIRDSIITIDNLEQFHRNNDQLKHLVLINSAILVPNEYILPTNIQPFHNLESLILDRDCEIRDKNCISMDYINVKYPNLTHLEFLVRIVKDSYVAYADLLDRSFPDTESKYPRAYGVPSYDPRKEAINYFKEFYQEGGKRFLSSLPKKLQVLKINTSIFKRPIQSLKESGLNPTELVFYSFSNDSPVGSTVEIFDDILCSTQTIQYLQELPCLETLSCSLGLDKKVFNGKLISSSIKHLDIGTSSFDSRKTLNLDKLFIAFPSLEELLILDKVCSLSAACITDNQPIYPNFRVLKINSSYDMNAVKFMRASLPNIKVLERIFSADIYEYHTHPEDLMPIMHGCIDVQWRSRLSARAPLKHYTIDLTGLNLDLFHLRTRFSHIRGDFEAKLYLRIKSGNMIRAYSLIMTPGSFRDLQRASETVEVNDVNVPNRITIKCDHIGAFKFNDCLVFAQSVENDD